MNIWVTIILCGFLNCTINTIYLVKAKNIVKRKFKKIKDGKEDEKEVNDNVKLYTDKKLEVAIDTYLLIFFCVLLYSYLSKSFKILDICNLILSIIYIRKLLEILFEKEKKAERRRYIFIKFITAICFCHKYSNIGFYWFGV